MMKTTMPQPPIQISSRGLVLHDWWADKIMRRAKKLVEFHPRITRCRAVVEVPHKHRHKGRLYTVRIDLEVPGHVVIVDREPSPTLNEAIDRAFDAVERRLEDEVRVQRRLVKHHEGPEDARVVELFPESGYGFLVTADDRRVYFHRNALIDVDFRRLTPGSRVRYVEEQGDKGPQARSVRVVKIFPRQERRRRLRKLQALTRAASRRGAPPPLKFPRSSYA